MLNLSPIQKASFQIANMTNYLNKSIPYLRNIQIVECDIHHAGFSALQQRNKLTAEQIQHLDSLPKYERNVEIGLLIRKDPSLNSVIEDGIRKARQAFVIVNNIEPANILAIKKDAIFIIRQVPDILQIGKFEFAIKHRYSSYAYASNKEFYYSEADGLSIKGIDEEAVARCSNGFVKQLQLLFKLSEINTQDILFKNIKSFHQKYLSKQMPLEVYRELDSGYFRIDNFEMDEIVEADLENLDISANLIKYFIPIACSMV